MLAFIPHILLLRTLEGQIKAAGSRQLASERSPKQHPGLGGPGLYPGYISHFGTQYLHTDRENGLIDSSSLASGHVAGSLPSRLPVA